MMVPWPGIIINTFEIKANLIIISNLMLAHAYPKCKETKEKTGKGKQGRKARRARRGGKATKKKGKGKQKLKKTGK